MPIPMGPGQAPTPALPGMIAGSPSGPGGSPAMAPGGGAGNQAVAHALMKAMIDAGHKALSAFPVNSPPYIAVDKALALLTKEFGGPQHGNLVPEAIQQMGMAAKQGRGLPAAVAPPMQPSAPPGASPEMAEAA